MDNRGLSTVVEKLLSLSIVVLYISLLTTVLYGGAVPSYRGAVGAELGERTLSEATARVEQTVPPAARSVDATRRVDLPGTIEGTTYRIRADNGTLVLDHPHPDVGGRARPILPSRVTAIEGEWTSGGPLVVSVTGNRTNMTVSLEGPA
jgi:hypothetical protein